MADRPYQVLARKWRPRRFSEVVGQPAIVRTLSNALDQRRIAHAYCLSGIRGVGKTTLARLFAKGLDCHESGGPTSEPCGACPACVEIEESRNLDVVEMDAASQTGVDDIRQLNEFARYTPSRDRYRVFIIDEAHMLSNQAFNALLKTLEEPPPHVVFMLATTEPHKILATVLSRCQHYPLGRISQAEITGRLREICESEGVTISDDALALVAMAADGSLRDGQSLLDKVIAFSGDEVADETVVDLLGMVDRELLARTVSLIADGDVRGVLELVNDMVERGVDLHQYVLDLIGHFRALLVVRSVPEPASILHLPEADVEQLREQAGAFEVDDLDRAFSLLSASEYRIKSSEMPRYHVEMVLARLARMPGLEPIEELLRRLDRGEGGGESAGGNGRGTGGTRRRGSPTARAGSGGDPHRASGPAAGGDRHGSSGTPADGGMHRSSGPPADDDTRRASGPSGSSRSTGNEPAAAGSPRPAGRGADGPVPVTHPEAAPPDARRERSVPAGDRGTRSGGPRPPGPPRADSGGRRETPAATGAAPAESVPVPEGRTLGPAAGQREAPATPVSTPDRAGPPSPEVGDPGPGEEGPGTQRPPRPAEGPTPTGDAGGTVERVVQELRGSKPVIARLVDRARSAELREDVLWLSFPPTGIIRSRLRERSALDAIEAAAEAALGRPVRIMTSFAEEDDDAPEPTRTAPEPQTGSPGRARAEDARREELWSRVEDEPMVRRFVDALQGHLTDVEDA